MHDVPQFEHNPAYRALSERIACSAEDAQALADLTLEIGGNLDVTHEEEHELIAQIGDRLAGLDQVGAVLPTRLMKCRFCEAVRDRAPGGVVSLCLCQGVVCRQCHAGRTRRPASDYYDAHELTIWHVPHFGALAQCRHCRDQSKQLGDQRWQPASARFQSAARALTGPAISFGDELPPFTLLALHGDVEVWHHLKLGSPPDGRPLFVGTAMPELSYTPPGLRVATWHSGDDADLDALVQALLVRWEPPLNTEIETPWTRADLTG